MHSLDFDNRSRQSNCDGAGQERTQTVLNSCPPVTTTLNAEGLATSIAEGVAGAGHGPYTSSFGYAPNDLPLTATLPGGADQWG